MLVTIQLILVFDVMFHDSLFAYNTQCTMQYVPSLIPITGLSQSSTPHQALSLFSGVHTSHGSFPLLFTPFILPFLLLPISLLFLMFHKRVKPYDNCHSLLDLFHLA